MLYRNTITGAEFESKSKISAPNWIAVGAESPKEIKAPEETKEDPKPETKKAAPKKTTKRTRK